MAKAFSWLLALLILVGACRSSREEVGGGALTVLVYDTAQPCELAHFLKAAFEASPPVERVEVAGLDARVLVVELDDARRASFALSFARVEEAVRAFFKNEGLSVTADSARSVVEVVYPTCNDLDVDALINLTLEQEGRMIPLSAVAQVSVRAAPQETVYHEGERALKFHIQPLSGQAEVAQTRVEEHLHTAHARFSFTHSFATRRN